MLHVKLFSVASPIPLPEWFQKWSDCCLRKKSMLENFPGHIRNFVGVKKLPDDILSELELIQYKKPVDKPKYSVNMLRYALLLRYTSVQAYLLVTAVSFTFIKPSEETYWRWNWATESSQLVLMLFCCLMRFICQKIHNTKMGDLLVLITKKICTKML